MRQISLWPKKTPIFEAFKIKLDLSQPVLSKVETRMKVKDSRDFLVVKPKKNKNIASSHFQIFFNCIKHDLMYHNFYFKFTISKLLDIKNKEVFISTYLAFRSLQNLCKTNLFSDVLDWATADNSECFFN